jgi:hypothetical protein
MPAILAAQQKVDQSIFLGHRSNSLRGAAIAARRWFSPSTSADLPNGGFGKSIPLRFVKTLDKKLGKTLSGGGGRVTILIID